MGLHSFTTLDTLDTLDTLATLDTLDTLDTLLHCAMKRLVDSPHSRADDHMIIHAVGKGGEGTVQSCHRLIGRECHRLVEILQAQEHIWLFVA